MRFFHPVSLYLSISFLYTVLLCCLFVYLSPSHLSFARPIAHFFSFKRYRYSHIVFILKFTLNIFLHSILPFYWVFLLLNSSVSGYFRFFFVHHLSFKFIDTQTYTYFQSTLYNTYHP